MISLAANFEKKQVHRFLFHQGKAQLAA